MIEFLIEFNVIMLAVVAGLFVACVAVAHAAISKLKAERDEAIARCDRLQRELGQAKSSGADLAQRVGWRRERLMNKPEFALFLELQRTVEQSRSGHRLFAQVSFGAFLDATARADLSEIRDAAFYAVQRKVADFLLIDRYGQPVAVIEYQGDGHYQGNAHDRDHAKRVACQRAGISYIEVSADGLTQGQRIDIGRLLGVAPQVAAE